MIDFLHIRPEFPFFSVIQRLHQGLHMIPPVLRSRIRRHHRHVFIVIVSVILEVGKEIIPSLIDGIILQVTFPDHLIDAGKRICVIFLILFQITRFNPDHLPESLNHCYLPHISFVSVRSLHLENLRFSRFAESGSLRLQDTSSCHLLVNLRCFIKQCLYIPRRNVRLQSFMARGNDQSGREELAKLADLGANLFRSS